VAAGADAHPEGPLSGCALSFGSCIGLSEFLARRHTADAMWQQCNMGLVLRPTDQREQRLLVRLTCNFDGLGARRGKRQGNLGG
jgi:hypothetical protein